MEGLNVEIRTARTGEDGLKQAARYFPDIIFLDLNLPRIKGPDVLKRLKENRVTAPIPVIILTTSSNPDEARELYAEGAASFVSKPVTEKCFANLSKAFDFWWLRFALIPKSGPPSSGMSPF